MRIAKTAVIEATIQRLPVNPGVTTEVIARLTKAIVQIIHQFAFLATHVQLTASWLLHAYGWLPHATAVATRQGDVAPRLATPDGGNSWIRAMHWSHSTGSSG